MIYAATKFDRQFADASLDKHFEEDRCALLLESEVDEKNGDSIDVISQCEKFLSLQKYDKNISDDEKNQKNASQLSYNSWFICVVAI